MDIPELTQEIESIAAQRQARLQADAARTQGRHLVTKERNRYQGVRVTPVTYIYPDYFSPTSQWSRALDAVPTVDWVLINPASGPGETPNSDYQAQAARARAGGALVMGYISTSWGTVDPASVRSQVTRHLDWYGVDGLFLDEGVSGWQADDTLTAYYEDLYAWVQSAHPGLTVTTNPGAASTSRVLRAADIVVTYENTAAVYLATAEADLQPAHYLTEPRAKFWHLIHGVTDRAQAEAVLEKAQGLHVGHVYLTDDALPNPWDRLPAGWLWDLQVQSAGSPVPNPSVGSATVPASATAPGTPGDVAYDATHLYVCVAANSWRRSPLTSW